MNFQIQFSQKPGAPNFFFFNQKMRIDETNNPRGGFGGGIMSVFGDICKKHEKTGFFGSKNLVQL
jgi:hypothetical protein